MAKGHADNCGCGFCRTLARRVVTSDHWHAEHAHHGEKSIEPFTYQDGADTRTHSSIYWLACPCGARQLRSSEIDR